MLLLNIEYIPGKKIEALGIAKGSVVQSKNFGKAQTTYRIDTLLTSTLHKIHHCLTFQMCIRDRVYGDSGGVRLLSGTFTDGFCVFA